jgi:Glycosyl transferase family 2
METISQLRLTGIGGGCLLICSSFLYFRGLRWNRSGFLLLTSCGLFLTVISLDPTLLDFVLPSGQLYETAYPRIQYLTIIAILSLFVLLAMSWERIFLMRVHFDRLTRAIGLKDVDPAWLQSAQGTDILIIMPAYNEADNLPGVLGSIPPTIDGMTVKVLVVDDCSSDGTAECSRRYGATVATNIINRGQGGASRLGYDVAARIRPKVIVTMDADGQHSVNDLPVVIRPILAGEADFVIGSRILGSQTRGSLMRKIGIHLLSAVVSVMTAYRITDVSSGYKAFSIEGLTRLKLFEDQFQAAETIMIAAKAGLRIREVPIRIEARHAGTSKKGTDLRYGAGFTKALVKAWFR